MLELTIRLVASLAIVIGLMLLIARFTAGRFGGKEGSMVQVLHRQALNKNSTVSVVTVGGRVLVLGTTEQQVNILTELDPAEIDPTEIDPAELAAAEPRTEEASAQLVELGLLTPQPAVTVPTGAAAATEPSSPSPSLGGVARFALAAPKKALPLLTGWLRRDKPTQPEAELVGPSSPHQHHPAQTPHNRSVEEASVPVSELPPAAPQPAEAPRPKMTKAELSAAIAAQLAATKLITTDETDEVAEPAHGASSASAQSVPTATAATRPAAAEPPLTVPRSLGQSAPDFADVPATLPDDLTPAEVLLLLNADEAAPAPASHPAYGAAGPQELHQAQEQPRRQALAQAQTELAQALIQAVNPSPVTTATAAAPTAPAPAAAPTLATAPDVAPTAAASVAGSLEADQPAYPAGRRARRIHPDSASPITTPLRGGARKATPGKRAAHTTQPASDGPLAGSILSPATWRAAKDAVASARSAS